MAGLLSLIIPGLGQLCLGHLVSGAAWFVVIMTAYALSGATLGLGLIIALPLHLWCIVSAYQAGERQRVRRIARAMEQRRRSQP